MAAVQRKIWIALGSAAMFCIVVAGLTALRQREAIAVAAAEAVILHRIVSQRVDQHDAHLTSLAALAQAADPPPVEAIRQVATSIIRFYPRIVAIDVIDLTRDPPRALLSDSTPVASVVNMAASAGPTISLLPVDGGERLRLVKRVPTEGPAHAAIVLAVDLRSLVATDAATSRISGVELILNNRNLLFEHAPDTPLTKVFDAPLASRTQPLRLVVSARADPRTLPSWEALLAISFMIAIAGYGLDRLIEARRSVREARARELLAAHEAKLAHASRVNAMGELASGIAHELTQPLTAILSHSQAGQKLASRPEFDQAGIAFAFEAAARNAKRAGDILARLRSWISMDQPAAGPVDLTSVISEVTRLLAGEAARSDVVVRFIPTGKPAIVTADRVHMEQIVFNLVRNAIEALRQVAPPRVITIASAFDGDVVHVDILDNGPGFSPDALGRVFEPFFTTRPDGMGLGLAICTRLVERYGGTLTADNRPEGGARLRVSMPLGRAAIAPAAREAAE